MPVALIFPNSNETTLEHECIHLCQLLNSQAYQLTLTERTAIFRQNVEIVMENRLKTNPEQALDLLIRLTCYKVWIELEAHYFVNAGSSESQLKTLNRAYRSALPFETFENGIHEWGIGMAIPNAMDRCEEAFPRFCNELESQVAWIKDLVANSGSKTLYEALLWCKEEFEVEALLGPIGDEEVEDEDYKDYDIASILNLLGNDDANDDMPPLIG